MIICSNCGTTNPSNERICRTCGALLPVSSKSPRMKIMTEKKKGTSLKSNSVQKKETKPAQLELQEIPKEYEEPPSINSIKFQDKAQDYNEENEIEIETEKEVLREITPKPFKGSIISPFPKTKKISSRTSLPSENVEANLIKQKQLEEDMTKVLRFLSKKVTVKELPTKKIEQKKEDREKVLTPSSMNEILKELLKLDLHIEASAIIKNDGTILASAISSRISDSLFAAIGQSLSLIGKDIIESLSAGKLLNISLRGTNAVLDLAPIDFNTPQGNDMILIILSNPRVKSGIIHFAANIVKKQVKEYLGLK